MPVDKAVIWDMDGVIASTAPYHLKAWQEVFRKRGVEFTKRDFSRHFGQRNDSIIKSAMGEVISREEMETIADEKEKCFRRRLGKDIRPLPGVIELMGSLLRHGFKMALASSAPPENISLITRSLGIERLFHAIISGHEVPRGKPAPDVFLLAAERLGIEPARCIVVEDAVAGVQAAKRAGMSCLAVTNTHTRDRLLEADLVVDSLADVGVDDLENLLNRGG